MKTNKLLTSMLSLGVLAMIFTGCKKDEDEVAKPTPTNEEELITTLQVNMLENGSTGSGANFYWRDIDGEGGNDPVIDTIKIDTSKTYAVSLSALDESKSPAEDITTEISAEADEHIFCFSSSNSNLGIVRTDTDGTYEIGIQSNWTTNSTAFEGTVTITLKHQPGSKDGTCTPGETDIEVTFPVQVK